MLKEQWFESWFDSKYYHILYDERDVREAEIFVSHLVDYLSPIDNARILDLACGSGRFSHHLAEAGYDVTGVDLSLNSINEALEKYPEIDFFVHDKRKPFRINYFDFIFSFFTSFGYFKTDKEHIKSLRNIHSGLKKGGVFVLDFINVSKLKKASIKESHTKEGITFLIDKRVEENHIVKKISFVDDGKSFEYEERVRRFSLDELKNMLPHVGFQVEAVFGDYFLNEFIKGQSERVIIVAKK